MYKGFNLKNINLSASFIERYATRGETVTDPNRQRVRRQLAVIAGSAATLDGTQIQNTWFPQANADVFISHSHTNVQAAMALAGWLKEDFDLTAFVDSSIWGYADDLLKLIDTEYCLNPGGETYSYEKRNESTSHVHMMLLTALGMIIDQTECLLFLNTPDSISSSEVISKTKSPWIYAELMIAGIVREQEPERYQSIKTAAAKGFFESREILKSIEYAIPNIERLKEIDRLTLQDWIDEEKVTPEEHVLDVFYRVAARS